MYDKNNSRENSNMAYSDVVQEYYKLVCRPSNSKIDNF